MIFKKLRSRKKQDKIMYIIAGLGNPTSKYEGTRHNIGFDALDALADSMGISFHEKKHHAMCGKGVLAGKKVLLMKPLTYMNNSGEAIQDAMNFYKLDPARDLLVIYDDISLDPGNLRIRKKGSAGGHNGIKDIIAMVGSDQFARIKIGVGEKPKNWDLADYVLGRFDKKDRQLVEEAIQDTIGAAQLIVGEEIDEAMNRYNGKKK